MMLAAAFRSWVRSSGSCMTSSRKLITLHLSSSLVSKSCGKMAWGGSGYCFQVALQCWAWPEEELVFLPMVAVLPPGLLTD
jgi:hypothetical protein